MQGFVQDRFKWFVITNNSKGSTIYIMVKTLYAVHNS